MEKVQVIDISDTNGKFSRLMGLIGAGWVYSERNALIKWYPYNEMLEPKNSELVNQFNKYLVEQGMVIENELLPKEDFYVYVGCLKEGRGYLR